MGEKIKLKLEIKFENNLLIDLALPSKCFQVRRAPLRVNNFSPIIVRVTISDGIKNCIESNEV